MSSIAAKEVLPAVDSEIKLEPLFGFQLSTNGRSFHDYLSRAGGGFIFNTATHADTKDFPTSVTRQELELVTITGGNSLLFPWSSKVRKLGLEICPWETAFEIWSKLSTLDMLDSNLYIATELANGEKGVMVLGKTPLFVANSWLERNYVAPKPAERWIFCDRGLKWKINKQMVLFLNKLRILLAKH